MKVYYWAKDDQSDAKVVSRPEALKLLRLLGGKAFRKEYDSYGRCVDTLNLTLEDENNEEKV